MLLALRSLYEGSAAAVVGDDLIHHRRLQRLQEIEALTALYAAGLLSRSVYAALVG